MSVSQWLLQQQTITAKTNQNIFRHSQLLTNYKSNWFKLLANMWSEANCRSISLLSLYLHFCHLPGNFCNFSAKSPFCVVAHNLNLPWRPIVIGPKSNLPICTSFAEGFKRSFVWLACSFGRLQATAAAAAAKVVRTAHQHVRYLTAIDFCSSNLCIWPKLKLDWKPVVVFCWLLCVPWCGAALQAHIISKLFAYERSTVELAELSNKCCFLFREWP